jgi:hypothetical protein
VRCWSIALTAAAWHWNFRAGCQQLASAAPDSAHLPLVNAAGGQPGHARRLVCSKLPVKGEGRRSCSPSCSTFAQECVVKHVSRWRLTTPRRKSRPQPMLDDALPENPASAVFDDTLSSSRAVEGDLAAPSRRAPSHAMLDDVVSQKPPIWNTRWHPARKHLRSKVLDSLLRVPSRAYSPGESHQTSRQTVLDSGRSSSPSVGRARRYGVVKARFCRCSIVESRRILSSASSHADAS